MIAKRALTFIFGLILASMIAKGIVFYFNPPFRLHGVGYEFNYSKLNYLQFLILFLIPGIVAIFMYRANPKIMDSPFDRTAAVFTRMFRASIQNKEKILVVSICLFWVFSLMENAFFINLVESKNPFEWPFDTYHEGEKIGFLYTFLNNEAGLQEVFMHGYFIEILTPYLVYLIAPENYAVIGYRFLYTMQTLSSWLGVIWVIREIVSTAGANQNKVLLRLQFIFFSLVFVVGNNAFLQLDYQQGFIFFQLGLILYFLRKLNNPKSSPRLILTVSFIYGFSIPTGLLYSTKFGLIYSAVFAVTVFLMFFHERYKLFLIGSLPGLFSSGAIFLLLLGWREVLEVGAVFLDLIEFFPYRYSSPFISDGTEHYLWIPQLLIGIFIICGTYLFISLKESKDFRSFVCKNIHILILLSLSILHLKIGLDLSDQRHFRAMASPGLLLSFLLAGTWLARLNNFSSLILKSYELHKSIWILALIFVIFMNMHPKEAFRHMKPYWKYISTPDDKLLAKTGYGYLNAVKAMRPEIQGAECFYTLTAESTWYYYFKKPSCSRYHSFNWAISKKARYEVIKSLRSKRPEIILFSNYRSNRDFVLFHWSPEVYEFVYQNYRPYKLIENHWFWKRSAGGMAKAKISELDITTSITNYAYNNSETFIVLSGISSLKNFYNIDGIYITSLDHETPLAVATYGSRIHVKNGILTTSWSIKVPMVNIFPEAKGFQLWGYSSGLQERVKIGESFKLDYSRINIKRN